MQIYYERGDTILSEEYSRRKLQHPASTSKPTIAFVILLLFINTLALSVLLFWNVQASSTQVEQLNSIEKQVSQLDQRINRQAPVTENTEHNVPVRESSTQSSQSSSVAESSSQTTSSSEDVQQTQRSSEPVVVPAATVYTVQSGDTLSVIAERNKLSLQDLMVKNNLSDSTVYIGQVLSL